VAMSVPASCQDLALDKDRLRRHTPSLDPRLTDGENTPTTHNNWHPVFGTEPSSNRCRGRLKQHERNEEQADGQIQVVRMSTNVSRKA
jgi:hypothetical protein